MKGTGGKKTSMGPKNKTVGRAGKRGMGMGSVMDGVAQKLAMAWMGRLPTDDAAYREARRGEGRLCNRAGKDGARWDVVEGA